MWISAREACRILDDRLGLSRQQALLLLQAGLAGDPVTTPSGYAYDVELVAQLATRPEVDTVQLAQLCPRGLFVARVGRRPAALFAEGPWQLSVGTRAHVDLEVARSGYFPYVETVAGLVVTGLGIVGVSKDPSGARPRGSP